MKENISTIVTIYKTPLAKLDNLKIYKKFELFLFEQEGSKYCKKKIKQILRFKFKYFFSKKNIGLSKSSNYLFRKIKTRYFLFTQPDIQIDTTSILNLKKIFRYDKNIIFVTPSILQKKKLNKKFKKKIKFVKKVKAACMMVDAYKLKEIGFFDEDYFLYWEDIDLMKKVNNTKYKMVVAKNIFAKHYSSQSSEDTFKIQFLRKSNFMYGELLYDFKHREIRYIKISRKFVQNVFLFFFNLLFFDLKRSIINLASLIGILKFILYLFKKF